MRRGLLGAGLAAIVGASLVAGCGGGPKASNQQTTDTANPGAVRHLQPASKSDAAAALKASQCMRAHGVPNFPDPILGHFGFTVDSGVDPSSAQFKAADSYCEKRYLHPHRLPPAEIARRNDAAVKFSACMRAHGVPDYPDPDGQAAINLPTDDYERTPKVAKAAEACKSLFIGKGFVFVLPIPHS